MKRSRMVLRALLALALTCAGLLSLAHSAQAAPLHVFGDPHSCQGLGQGATKWPWDYTAEPFDAWQIPRSSTYGFTNYLGNSDYIVGCQPAFWESNFNNANWDGYGNPFQCVELIARYDQLRWHDNYGWGDANTIWQNHPGHFTQYPNGINSPPEPGDILVWTGADHVAIITQVNYGSHYAHILQQNATYNGGYDFSDEILYFGVVHADGSYWYAFTGANTWYDQNGNGNYRSSGPQPDGWLR
jgi:hypothetical protein